MKILISIFVFLLGSLFHSQSAEEIIEKNIEATGGKTAWKDLKSIILYGNITLGLKDTYPVKIYQKRPNLSKTLLIINSREYVVEGYDGKKGYVRDFSKNLLRVKEDYVPENFESELLNWKSKGYIVRFLGREKVLDRECYKIELGRNQYKTLCFFDIRSFMILKEEKEGEWIFYSDYKKTEGYTFPFRIQSIPKDKDHKGGGYILNFSKIEVNPEILSKTFLF
ncbi:MAG: histidine kinase [Bergeyella sp.]|nr:histidine kinase [Bergeyella sp.]